MIKEKFCFFLKISKTSRVILMKFYACLKDINEGGKVNLTSTKKRFLNCNLCYNFMLELQQVYVCHWNFQMEVTRLYGQRDTSITYMNIRLTLSNQRITCKYYYANVLCTLLGSKMIHIVNQLTILFTFVFSRLIYKCVETQT